MMRICGSSTLLVGLIVAFGGDAVVSAADVPDPAIGTWTLNVAKSKYNPGPAPRSQTRTYEEAAQGVTWTSKTVAADGSERSVQCTFKFDGKDYPVTGSSIYDTLSLKRINARAVAFTGKKAGRVTETGTRKVSADGKAMTVSMKGTDAKGVPFNAVQVFDKQ
jgi:hypothetical protein